MRRASRRDTGVAPKGLGSDRRSEFARLRTRLRPRCCERRRHSLRARQGRAPQRTTNYASGSTSDDIIAWMPTITYLQEPKQRLESVVRILCGSSNPYVDANGIEWSADQFFAGGATVANTFEFEGVTPTTTDQMLYRHGRKGKDFRYSIPVRLGLYAVRIKVAEPEHEWFFERPMNVTINNRPVLANFDVCHAARRWKRAYDRTFHSIVPDADGKIVLRFSGGWDPLQRTDEAIVQAIEVLPESKSAVRINCGSDSSFVDWNSCVWDADRAFQGGKAIAADTPVSQASPTIYDQGLYRTALPRKIDRLHDIHAAGVLHRASEVR